MGQHLEHAKEAMRRLKVTRWPRGIVMTVWSDVLNDRILLAADGDPVANSGGLVVYWESEVRKLVQGKLAPDLLRILHATKKALPGAHLEVARVVEAEGENTIETNIIGGGES